MNFPLRLDLDGGEGRRLRAVDWGGEGPPVLLLHGMGAHTGWWDPAAPHLASELRTVAMDLRGHGESHWAEPPAYRIGDYADDIESVRRAFGWDEFYLVGHSMGARAAIHYASRHPRRVRRLAVLDFLSQVNGKSRAKYEKKMKRRQPSYAEKETILSGFHLQPRGTSLSEDALRVLAEGSVRRLPGGRWTWKFDWRAFFFEYAPIWDETRLLEMPCLVLRGERSTVMPRADFERVVASLKDGHGIEIPGTYHHIPLDAPKATAELLLRFSRGANHEKAR